MSQSSYQNTEFVDQAHSAIVDERERQHEEALEYQETRDRLEGHAPPDDIDLDAIDPDSVIRMTDDLRAGSMVVEVPGHGSVPFGKPNGRTSIRILSPIDYMRSDESDATPEDIALYVWHTLASWSERDEYDVEFWADEVGLADAIGVARTVAVGGSNPN